MADEKLLVGRDLLYAHDTHARLELDDLVDEQERVAVREDLLDSDGIVYDHYGQYKLQKGQ